MKRIIESVIKDFNMTIDPISHFQKNFGINFVVDPRIDFDEIPLPFRNRLFMPSKRKFNDPIGFNKKGNKVIAYYE